MAVNRSVIVSALPAEGRRLERRRYLSLVHLAADRGLAPIIPTLPLVSRGLVRPCGGPLIDLAATRRVIVFALLTDVLRLEHP